MSQPRAMILGCAGAALAPEERDFFRAVDPLGFILFQRNCLDPAQVRGLVDALRASVGRADAPVLIDQDGGRVAPLRPPHWRTHPSADRFRALTEMNWAMTAHTVYTAIDGVRPATLSPVVIAEVIRGAIGFDGVLVSDDLSMQALGGGLGERASGALAAGCDVVLHCNGRLDEMRAVAEAVGAPSPAASRRVAAGEARRRRTVSPPERADREARLAAWFGAA